MLRAVTSFRGEVPLLTPRSLPENAAQVAINARLYTGDLTAFRQFALKKTLANAGPVRTISLLDGYWLSWDEQVDVARGIVPGDTTFRTYLTGLDLPRFTNLALATTGPEPYPVVTRPLGVPPPDSPPTTDVGVDTTVTTFSVDVTDDCSDLASNWSTSPGQGAAGDFNSTIEQDDAFGNPAPSFKLAAQNNGGAPTYATRNFGTKGGTVVEARYQGYMLDVGGSSGGSICALFACGDAGDGARVLAIGDIGGGAPILHIMTGASFADGQGSSLAQAAGPGGSWGIGLWYDFDVKMVSNPDGTSTITAALYLGSVKLCEVTTTNTFTNGNLFGPLCAKGDDLLVLYYDNWHVQASGSNGVVITNIATSYVYTFVNDLGEESAPSEPSATILRPDGVSVTITSPTSEPTGVSADYFIATKRIYRAATGSGATAFRFVAEIPLSQADYIDTLTDTQLGEVLQSDNWALPPNDLRGILALPNGVMVGFSKNQLCLSAQNHPHAWPVEYRLNTDTDIVGIGNIDTTVVIGTESFLYVAGGNDPANYSMSKFEVPHAASSKQSFAYITSLGVVFSGPDGLMVCSGPNQVRNLTQGEFTHHQWQALNPASIVSVAHNDIYFMFWEAGSARGCYAVDLRADGFGIVQMAFHASAAYVDPVEDKMYLVLDADTEPDDPELPVQPVLPAGIDAKTIYEFEGDPVNLMTYRWRSKLWLEPYPCWHSIAQVRAETYDNLLVRFFGDGVMLDEIVVEGEVEFTTTPPDASYTTFEMEVLGTDTVRVMQAADDVMALDGLSAMQASNQVG